VLVFIFLAAAGRVSAILDTNGNDISDIWEQIHGATGIDPNLDSDGDGFPNVMEIAAGTDPFNPNSYPKIAGVALSGTNLVMTLPGVLGKSYQLQSAQTLGDSSSWTNESSVVMRPGMTNVSFPVPTDVSGKFFRVMMGDVDSDGDGLTDWEEYQLGLDPLNPNSNGRLDSNGIAISDFQYAANNMATQNVINIVATDPSTVQPDAGQSAADLGQFTVTRSGFGLDTVTVQVNTGGPGAGFAAPGVDYVDTLPTSVTFSAGTLSKTILVIPLANTNRQVPVIAQLNLLSGGGYSLGQQASANVVIYPSPTASGSGLAGAYYTNCSTTYSNAANFNPTNLFLTRVDPAIDFTWTNGTSPNLTNGLYCVRWTGQIQPEFSETYFFDTISDDGVRLWVNDQMLIDKWQTQSGTEWTNAIALQANTRYDIKLEYFQHTGKAQIHLYWYSASQPRQIIPADRFYPANSATGSTSNAPSVITSPLTAVGFVGQPFRFNVTGANLPLGFTATNLPPGLAFNTTNGALTGIPLQAGY